MFRNPLIDAVVVLVVVLLIFGPKRLPALGQGLREFKDTIGGDSPDGEQDGRPALPESTAAPATAVLASEREPAALDPSAPRH